MEINENIKLLCKARGISFADLADRLKITRQTLYKQSTGAAQLASIERIAAALALPAWIILHPAPLAALLQIRIRQDEGPAPSNDPDQDSDGQNAGTIKGQDQTRPEE